MTISLLSGVTQLPNLLKTCKENSKSLSNVLIVNESKTELCLFHRKDHLPITIFLNRQQISLINEIKLLGVTLNSKLQWTPQVAKSIKKAKWTEEIKRQTLSKEERQNRQ